MAKKTASNKRPLTAEDLTRLNVITKTEISPDENRVAYTLESISADKRKYFSHIYMLDLQSGESKQYTHGEVNDRGLAWSNDGNQLTFVSTRDKKTGIYIMPADGGAEKQIIEMDGAFTSLMWTPAGKEIVFLFRYNDSHKIKDDKKKKEAPLYRHITTMHYRSDGEGFLPGDKFHIWKVNIESKQATQITKGRYDDMTPALSPDGKLIAFVSNKNRFAEYNPQKIDLYIVPTKGGKIRQVPAPEGPKFAPSFSPDGKKIAYLGHDNLDDAWGVTNFHVWSVGVDGNPKAKDMVPEFDRQCYDQTIGDMGEGFAISSPVWSADGKRVYFVSADSGCTHIFYCPARGGKPTRVTHKSYHIKNFSLNGKKQKIAAVYSDLTTPSEISVIRPVFKGDTKSKALTSVNKELFKEVILPRTKEVWFKASDGFDLQGWLVTPPDMKKTKKYPAILEIHGGPRAQYGFTFYHEMLYLATKGYIVFYTNPRGGAGRGETFAGSIVADWGSIDYSDCMDAADYLERHPNVNKNKLGVTGGSYGGFMTNWIVGHTDRFKAAVTQRSVVDLISFNGTSDFGYEIRYEFGGQYWHNEETYVRCSPLTYAADINTPLLIIHSEQDLRCSMEQAEQLCMTLKMMRKKTEFVRFPEESHGLSRHGRPDRRIARLEWIDRWFKRYLKK